RIVGAAVSGLRSETRGQGRVRFAVGLLMLGVSALCAFVLASSGARVSGPGFIVGFFGLLGSGLLATVSGCYAMIVGRESRTVGRFVDRTLSRSH
ncbi:MAG: hypothetical protein AAGJ83_09930, partial [Planctomycetota bacterium]